MGRGGGVLPSEGPHKYGMASGISQKYLPAMLSKNI